MNSQAVTRYWQNIHAPPALPDNHYVNLIQRTPNVSSVDPASVRVGFNPAELYFHDLQKVYVDTLELFYDTYGGTTIGGVWNPAIVAGDEFDEKTHAWRVMLGFSSVPVGTEDGGTDKVKISVADLYYSMLKDDNRSRNLPNQPLCSISQVL